MKPTDITIEILKGIRDEVRGLRGDVHDLRGEVGGLREEVHGTNDRLDGVCAELRVHGQAIVKLIHETHGLNERFDTFLRGEHHEDHADLRARVGRLEAKVG
jgi:hypothetical protein